MLIVSRSTEQSVVVGEFDGFERVLKVTVLAVRGGQVRLGFEILDDEPTHESEVWEQNAVARPPNGRVDKSDRRLSAAARFFTSQTTVRDQHAH